MKVLLVEDEAGVRFMTANGLARAGYEVTEAPDGAAALRYLEEGAAPDVLITDIRMPGADGWTVARAYRERLPDLPVLYITGFSDESEPVPGGVVLPKPFRIAQMLATLASLTQAAPCSGSPQGPGQTMRSYRALKGATGSWSSWQP